MQKTKQLFRNSFRTLGLAFRFAPYLTSGIFALTIITYLAPIYQARLLGDIINSISEILGTGQELSAAILLIVLYASITAATRILGSLSKYLDKYHSLSMEHGLEIMMATKRAEIDLGHYEDPKFMDLLSRFNRGMWQLINMVTAQFTFVASLITILVSSVITTAIGWESYVIIILSSLPLFIVEFKFGNVTWHIWAENTPRMRMFDHVRYKFIHQVSNVQTKMLQNSNFLINKMRAILTSFRKDQYGVDNRRLFYSIGASIVAAAGFGYVFYSITTQVVAGIITVGTMVFLINILGQLVGSISSMLTDIARQFERDLYVNDFFKVIDTKPYVPVSKHPIPLKLSQAPTIEFRNVWFKYDGTETWILRGLNFKIKSGEKVALVGENGAGKSTLIKLLARIYDPSKGEILINNVDLRDIDSKEWLSYLAILLQDYVGYNFSIGESIAMGRVEEDVDMERAREAAMLSGAHSFIAQYKKGYDQQVGKDFEEGIELSKGQNQRLALARIIYRRGYVMILDEPTAAIDAKSEMEIFENMEKASGESTLVLITHRFNTTQNVDTIHVIEHGEIKESGNHRELLKRNGLYAEMFRAQAKSFLEDGTKHA